MTAVSHLQHSALRNPPPLFLFDAIPTSSTAAASSRESTNDAHSQPAAQRLSAWVAWESLNLLSNIPTAPASGHRIRGFSGCTRATQLDSSRAIEILQTWLRLQDARIRGLIFSN
ncbi:MAG: hypothetical protein L6R42_009979 [Xanthoria sp. 1 TBL-2021]|nr:MAG: hypothetical protein L6R42_009979 [Xanthoria sp. 1 TBL-2021]